MALNLLRKINLAKIGKTDLTKNVTIRVLSTENDEAAGIKEESLRYYRTAESNPLKHDERHYGRLYSVSYFGYAKWKAQSEYGLSFSFRYLMKNLKLLQNWRKIRTSQLSFLSN